MSEAAETKYELRELQSKDVFPMFKILGKIGIKEFRECFNTEDLKSIIADGEGAENEENGETEKGKTVVERAGVSIVISMASIVITHIPDCEQDIYAFLSGLSGMKKTEIAELPMADFASMIVDVFKQDGFMDFIQVVSKLFK